METQSIFHHIVQSLALDTHEVHSLFAATGIELDEQEIMLLLNPDQASGLETMPDYVLSIFLDALIDAWRGGKADSTRNISPRPMKITNNDVLKKLRIALNLQEQDLRAALNLVTIELTKSDLSALFRKPGQAQYKVCDDELLMDFITGFGLLLQSRAREVNADAKP